MISDKLINRIKSLGFRVFMRKPEDTYMLFTNKDGTKIGYLQDSGPEAISMSTVHKPNRTSGTGFGLFQHVDEDDLSRHDLEACFITCPHWASGDHSSIIKWRTIEEYRAADKFNAGYLER